MSEIIEDLKGKKAIPMPRSIIGGTTKAKSPMATLTKQFGIIDKRTRVEETEKEEKKLRIYTPMKGKKNSALEAIKSIGTKETNSLEVIFGLCEIVQQLVGVIEKLPENVMSFDDKAKVMQFKDVRIHKPMSEKMKKGIKKTEEKKETNDFLSALDDL